MNEATTPQMAQHPVENNPIAPTTTPPEPPKPPEPPAPTWGAPWAGPAHPIQTSYWRRALLPVALVVALAGWVILREADRLVGGLTVNGASASFGDVTGFFALSNTEAWETWGDPQMERPERILPLATAYLLGDGMFIVGYAAMFSVLFSWSRAALGFLAAAVLADVFETVGLFIGAQGVAGAHPPGEAAATWLAWFAIIKWLALGLMLVAGVFVRVSRHALWARTARALVALWVHRLTVIFAAGFGLLALAPFAGIYDQLPDVQRAWFDEGLPAGNVAAHAAGAGALLAITAAIFWYFGRRRTERAYRNLLERHEDGAAPRVDATITWWIAVPLGALGVSVLATYAPAGGVALDLAVRAVLVLVVGGAVSAQYAWSRRSARRWIGVVGFAVALGVLVVWVGVAAVPAGVVDVWYPTIVLTLSGLVVGASWWLRRRRRRLALPPLPRELVPLGGLIDSTSMSSEGWGTSTSSDWEGERPTKDQRQPGTEPYAEERRGAPSNPRDAAVRTTWLVGDALAVFVFAVAPLGLVRSLVGPALADLVAADPQGLGAVWAWLWAALIGCVLVPVFAVWVVWLGDGAISRASSPLIGMPRALFDPRAAPPARFNGEIVGLDALAVGVGTIIVGLATFWPQWFSQMGPVAVTILLLLAWSLLVGGIILSMQRRAPIDFFGQLGMGAPPVIAIVTLFAFLMSLFVSPPEVHALRTTAGEQESTTAASADEPAADPPEAPPADDRLWNALDTRFGEWLRVAAACGSQDGPVPMLLVAAEGGGARAAHWTVATMADIHDSGCLGAAMFTASGISGGSVGLAIDQVVRGSGAEDAETQTAGTEDAIRALTGPDPLARVVTGLLAGDFVAALTGARVPTAGDDWIDRGGHLELAWEEAVPELAQPFNRATPPASQPYVVLNSADSISGCRVSVTQLPIESVMLPSSGGRLTADDCGDPSTGAGFALEFDDVWQDCSPQLTWSTTALLSARFPFVTPGGRMPAGTAGACSGVPSDPTKPESERVPQAQLVDGGYSDGSGLGSLVDLMPEVVSLVAQHNEDCARTNPRAGCETRRAVVPIVVYIKNDRGFELDAEAERLAAEFLVPVAGLKANGLQNSEDALLQRLVDGLTDENIDGACGKSVICETPVVVISAATSPTIAAPLGWTLSDFSRDSLDAALESNAEECGLVEGYPTFGELLAMKDRKHACADSTGP